jgi:hypothetical protein
MLNFGEIKDTLALLLKAKRARDYWLKEKDPMDAVLNTLKHVGYVALSLVGASLVAFLSDDAGLTKALQDGGLPAVYVALAIPAFHVLLVTVQNIIKHLKEPKV